MIINKINYKLVNTAGQITAVVFGELRRNRYVAISNYLMGLYNEIEQVVFIEKNRIQTMGNELCINGSLAGAFLLDNSILEISGLDKPIKFTKNNRFISAIFPSNLVVSKKDNLILLQGIVYLITNDETKISKLFLKKLAKEYKVPASGIIKLKSNKITPIVYVNDTDSLVWENACGSGSLAYSIYSGLTQIIQPSGKIIKIKRNLKSFAIKVPVKVVKKTLALEERDRLLL